MKILLLSAALLTLNLAFAQTKAIANKSHSGDAASLAFEQDGNFGIAPERIDSVIKISPNAVVEINNFGWRDTVYNHPYFLKPGITLEEMKASHPRIIFVGFEQGKTKPVKKHQKKGTLYLMAILLAGTAVYTFRRQKKAA